MQKPKRLSPKDSGYKDWFSVRIKEELAYWRVDLGWDPAILKEAGLSLFAFSATTDIKIGAGFERRYKKNAALNLKCGVQIDSGVEKSTPQEKSMSITNVRVDGVDQANDVLEELSKLNGFQTWEIKSLEIYNKKNSVTLTFKRFNPDGTGVQLFLDSVETPDAFRYYYDIPLYDQQFYCNHIQEQVAHCERIVKEVATTKCVLQKHISDKKHR
jgi:hypothetical protein